MDLQCAACESSRPDEGSCPECGLALAAEESAPPATGDLDPALFPGVAADPPAFALVPIDDPASEDAVLETDAARSGEGTSPAEAPAPSRRRSRRLTAILCLLVAAALALGWLTRRESDAAFESQVRAVAGALGSRPVPTLDLERAWSRLEARWPEAAARALAQHTPWATTKPTPHAISRTRLARAVELDPDWALGLGSHPHPLTASRITPEAVLRRFLLARDAWAAVQGLGDVALSEHDRVDLEALGRQLELELSWDPARYDDEVLGLLDRLLDPVFALMLFPCCASNDREVAAAARLRLLPELLDEALSHVEAPSRAATLAAARRLERTAARLQLLHSGSRQPKSELALAIAVAQRGFARCRSLLLRDVLPRASGRLGIGADEYERLLVRFQGVSGGAEAVLRAASAQYISAQAEMTAREERVSELDGRWGGASFEELLERGPALVARVIEGPPRDDPGVRPIVAGAQWGADERSFYMPAGLRAPPLRPIVALEPPQREGEWPDQAAVRRSHVIAHEVYPGHHLQELLARESSCELRLLYDSRVLIEGWAVYAEDLAHKLNACRAPALLDRHEREWERLCLAWDAAFEALIHTRALPERELLALLTEHQGRPAELADLGDLARDPGLSSCYLTGRAELGRLRSWADEQDVPPARFHEQLLRAGPLPPILLERELKRALAPH